MINTSDPAFVSLCNSASHLHALLDLVIGKVEKQGDAKTAAAVSLATVLAERISETLHEANLNGKLEAQA